MSSASLFYQTMKHSIFASFLKMHVCTETPSPLMLQAKHLNDN